MLFRSRHAVEEALSFEEETAGRLMQREYVAAPEGDTVGDVIDRMREDSAELPDEFFEIYIVDAAMRPIGAVRVSSLLRSRREAPLREIMRAPLILIRPEMDQEEVAQTFQKYHMASAPVVDEAGRLTGMVTVDDIVDVISEESEEDLLRLAGVSEARAGVAFDGLWLEAPGGELMRRVASRRVDISDAREDVVRMQLKHEAGAIDWTRIDAARPPDAVAADARARLEFGPSERN